jgi:hypothetical protein
MRLLQQLLEGRQMRLPTAAARMPSHEVKPAGFQQLLLSQRLQLRPNNQLRRRSGVGARGQLVLLFTECLLGY